jgi:RNA-directed DNA polymerase
MKFDMTFSQYSKNFRAKATNAGYSEENIQKCLNYAKPLIEKGLPIIYNTTNFSRLVGYNKVYLKKAVLHTTYFYRKFDINKKSGGKREIKEPLPSLKEIQLWILQNILYELPVSRYAKAYVKKRNILDNVKFHLHKEKVMNLDIRNFFPSIKRASVEKIFLEAGYSSNLANLLSKLCCLDEFLPQGAPTSPYLSNIYMIPLDNALAEYCKSRQIRYTRYADDMTFSGEFDEQELIDFTIKSLVDLKLKLNEAKSKVMKQNVRQIVTGVVVNDKLQVPKSVRNNIRLEMYYLEKKGLAEHLKFTKNNKSNYIDHLEGKINHALHVNGDDKELLAYKEYLKKFHDADPGQEK